MLGRSKSGICGKKQIKPNKRERKRDPRVVSFRRWFLEMIFKFKTLLKLFCLTLLQINKTLQKLKLSPKFFYKSNHNTHSKYIHRFF